MKQQSNRRRKVWKSIINKQATSGLSASEFCRQNSLGIKSFYRWRRIFRNESSKPKVPVQNNDAVFIDMGHLENPSSAPSVCPRVLTITIDMGEGHVLTLRKS